MASAKRLGTPFISVSPKVMALLIDDLNDILLALDKEDKTEQTCDNCLYAKVNINDEPCNSCGRIVIGDGLSRWEPKAD